MTWTSGVSQGFKVGGYKSSGLTEYIWSKSKNEFIEIEKISGLSMFALSPKGVWFKKINQDWMGNKWESREKTKTDLIRGEYIDMLN